MLLFDMAFQPYKNASDLSKDSGFRVLWFSCLLGKTCIISLTNGEIINAFYLLNNSLVSEAFLPICKQDS